MNNVIRYLFYALVFTLPITLIKSHGVFWVYTIDPVLVLLIVSFVVLKLSNSNLKIDFCFIDLLILSLFLAISISFLLSWDIAESVPNYQDWVRILVIYFICRYLFQNNVVSGTQFRNIMMIVGVTLVVIGAIQAVTETRFGLIGNYFGEGRAQGGNADIGGSIVNRVSGTSPNPNIYAMWINLFFTAFLVNTVIKRKYLILFIASAIGGGVILSTLARGGTLAYFLFLAVLAWCNKDKITDTKLFVLSSVAVVLFTAAIAANQLVENPSIAKVIDAFSARMEQAENEKHGAGAEGRIVLMELGINLVSENSKVLLVGTGAGNFPNGIIIHNMWIRFLAEHGVIAFVLLVTLVINFILVVKSYKEKGGSDSEYWQMYFTCTMLPFLIISSQVYHTAGSYNIIIPLCIILAYVVSRRFMSIEESSSNSTEYQPANYYKTILSEAKPVATLVSRRNSNLESLEKDKQGKLLNSHISN